MAGILRYGMVGGHLDAFIGDVHRKALGFDPRARLCAGCFSSNEERSRRTGDAFHVAPDRIYPDFETMAKAEAARDDGIDFAVIVTPNVTHYPAAKAFLEAGIPVFCEKPLCFTVEQAQELRRLAREKGLLFGVNYAYTGYTMSRVMREMIQGGAIGRVLNVNAEYAQDWLLDELDPSAAGDMNMAVWRTDPAVTGISNCVGDIGTHIESFVSWATGLKIRRLLATTDSFGKALDMNANILLEYENGAHGSYWCSQVAAGHANGLVVRVFGDQGALEWVQEDPEVLRYTPKNEATRLLRRGTPAVRARAAALGRIPAGHPEGLYVAFANVYRDFLNALEAKRKGGSCEGFDYPGIDMGVRGVQFVHAVIASAREGGRWIEMKE